MMAMSSGALGARPALTWWCALKRLATARWTWVHTHKKPSGVWDLAILAEHRWSFPGRLSTLFFSHLDFWIITVRLHPRWTRLWLPRGGDLLSSPVLATGLLLDFAGCPQASLPLNNEKGLGSGWSSSLLPWWYISHCRRKREQGSVKIRDQAPLSKWLLNHWLLNRCTEAETL